VDASVAFIVLLIIAIFAVDLGRRWWRETAWKRRARREKERD
jgi:hypothetical protein